MMGPLPYLVVANLSVAAFWIGTKSNPADHPSRGTPLPPPSRPPDWVLGFLPDFRERAWGWGLEVFAGIAMITSALRSAGFPMLDPWDTLYGNHLDVLSSKLDDLLRDSHLSFVWLSPPCATFPTLRNLDKGGPLRPVHNPYGNALKMTPPRRFP